MDGFGERRVNRYKTSNQSFRSDIQGGEKTIVWQRFWSDIKKESLWSSSKKVTTDSSSK